MVISGGADERCAAALPSCGDGLGVGGVEPCAYRGRCSGFGTPRRLVGLAAGEESGALVHITWYLETQTVLPDRVSDRELLTNSARHVQRA